MNANLLGAFASISVHSRFLFRERLRERLQYPGYCL